MTSLLFLACWLEYHDTSLVDRVAFVEAVYAERRQQAREFVRRFFKRWYENPRRDILHEIACRASPFMVGLKNDMHRSGQGMDGGRPACNFRGRRFFEPGEDREEPVVDRCSQRARDLLAGR